MEGWLDPASRPRRNNNPGDIESGRFAIAHGAKGSDGRFAVFPTPEFGFGAMRALFQAPAYAGLSVSAAIARYAPSNENDTAHYISMVCEWCGCAATDTVGPLAALPCSFETSIDIAYR